MGISWSPRIRTLAVLPAFAPPANIGGSSHPSKGSPQGDQFIGGRPASPPNAKVQDEVITPPENPCEWMTQEEKEERFLEAALKGDTACLMQGIADGVDLQAVDPSGNSALHLCAQAGKTAACILLLDHGADLYAQNLAAEIPLHYAVQNNHPEVVRLLVEKDPVLIYTPNKQGTFPLFTAIENGFLEITKILILADPVIVHIPNSQKDMPLHIAVDFNRLEILDFLLTKEANLYARDGQGNYPIHRAALHGFTEAGKMMLDKEPGLIFQKNNQKKSSFHFYAPLHFSSELGHLEFTQMLLDKDANPHATDAQNNRPIHKAAAKGHTPILKLLYEKSSLDIFARNRDGNRPLHLSAKMGHIEATKFLLEKKPYLVFAKNKKHNRPLHLAAEGGHVEVVKLLLEAKAKVNATNIDGDTALHLASRKGHDEVVKVLLEMGIEIDQPNLDGNTSLMEAIKQKKNTVAKILIDAGAQANFANLEGMTPAAEALLGDINYTDMVATLEEGRVPDLSLGGGSNELVEVLLENSTKEDLNTPITNEDFTYLMFAALSGNSDLVENILAEGADVNRKDTFGNSALMYAAYRADGKIVQMLLEAGASVHVWNFSDPKEGVLDFARKKYGTAYIVQMLLDAGAPEPDRDED